MKKPKIKIKTILEMPPGKATQLFRKYLKRIKFIPIEKALREVKTRELKIEKETKNNKIDMNLVRSIKRGLEDIKQGRVRRVS